MRRYLYTYSLLVFLLCLYPQTSLAHDTSLKPDTSGSYFATADEINGATIEVKIVGEEQLINIQNMGDKTLVVLGYDNKTPWLKITPNSVFLNHNSEDYYLNSIPPQTVPNKLDLKPNWVMTTDEAKSWTWGDRRMQWLAGEKPTWLNNSTKLQKVLGWQISLTYGGQKGYIRGNIYWQNKVVKHNHKKAAPKKDTKAKDNPSSSKTFLIVPIIFFVLLIFYTLRSIKPKERVERVDPKDFGLEDEGPGTELIEDETDDDELIKDEPSGNELIDDDDEDETFDDDVPTTDDNDFPDHFPPLNMIDPL